MNGNASVSQYIYILTAVVHWLRRWPVITEVVDSSLMIDKDSFSFLYSLFV